MRRVAGSPSGGGGPANRRPSTGGHTDRFGQLCPGTDSHLWGLIACLHYAGLHLPPFGTRAAVEFLGSTLSMRLVDRFEDDHLHNRLAEQAVLGKL